MPHGWEFGCFGSLTGHAIGISFLFTPSLWNASFSQARSKPVLLILEIRVEKKPRTRSIPYAEARISLRLDSELDYLSMLTARYISLCNQ